MNPRVLIVDDSLTVRMDLAEAFEVAGFEATLCASAAQARQTLSASTFGLVVLDVRLPDADGVEFLAELRAAPGTSGMPVILLSSEAAVRDRLRGRLAGADEYAGKPYDRSWIVARARALVRGPEGAAAAGSIRRVLVIDDSATFVDAIRTALETAGYAVLTAATGEEGLRIAARERPDGIVVDGELPDADGAAVLRRIRLDPALQSTACVLLTAGTGREAEIAALGAGTDAYIRKGQGLDVVIARIESLLSERTRPPPGTASSLFGPKRVLAVDDSETYLQALGENLRLDGYDVVLARSGQEALDLLSAEPVDCVLLDLVMSGLSGQETCLRIKGRPEWREIPLLVLTAVEDLGTMLDSIRAGADDYITKSSDFEVVRARLGAQLRRKHVEGENRRLRDEAHRREIEAAEARAARELAESRAALLAVLERKNEELGRSNAALQEFAYVTSHDLQSPLRTIGFFADTIRERYRDRIEEEDRELLDHIVSGVGRMQGLVQGLLAYARAGAAQEPSAPIDLERLVDRVLRDLRVEIEEKRAEIDRRPLPVVMGSERELGQLFQNLIGNALKFSGTKPPRVRLRSEEAAEGWRLRVEDDGIGIDPADAGRLFRLFKRLHTAQEIPGTGIGLAIARRIVERHGGQIGVDGAPGRGATFWFTLSRGGPATSQESE